jgi:hypothetical protein
MSRINTLTSKQEERLVEFRDRWTAIGLSTAPAERELAEAAIREAYRAAGVGSPRTIVWCGSPLSQGLTRAIICDDSVRDSVGASVGASVRASVRESVRASVRESVWASVRASVGASVGDSVWASVWASVRDSVGASVRDSVGDSVGASVRDSVGASVGASVWVSVRDSVWASVGDSVGASVGDSVGASVRDSVGASVRDSVWESGFGQHDADWLAFYEYLREVVGLKQETCSLTGLLDQAKHAGWYLPHKHICWVSERHHVLRRDDSGLLHCVDGPAVMYPDGWSIYAWHGVRVPAWIIEQPDKLTPQGILKERNAEVRRVMMERLGVERFVQESHATVLDRCPEHQAELLTIDLPNDPEKKLTALKLVDFSPKPSDGDVGDVAYKTYIVRVPPNFTRALDALAWSYDMKPEEYVLTKQT